MDFWHEFIKDTIHVKNALYLKHEMQRSSYKAWETEQMNEEKCSGETVQFGGEK